MKKLNLETVKSSLKRDEMRSVKGGSGGGYCSKTVVACSWSTGKYQWNANSTTTGWVCCK